MIKHEKKIFSDKCKICNYPMLELGKDWVCPNNPQLNPRQSSAVVVLWKWKEGIKEEYCQVLKAPGPCEHYNCKHHQEVT